MIRAILIEDRSQRQQIFLGRKGFDLHMYDDVLRNVNGGEDPVKWKEAFQNRYEVDRVLMDYGVIMTHRSAWDNEARLNIRKHCEEQEKALVYFSGGVSSSTFYQKSNFQFLTMNSGDFYSSNLKTFLDALELSSDVNLRVLAFGKQWEIGLLSQLHLKLHESIHELEIRIPFEPEPLSIEKAMNISDFEDAFGLNDERLKQIILNSKGSNPIGGVFSQKEIENPKATISKIQDIVEFEIHHRASNY